MAMTKGEAERRKLVAAREKRPQLLAHSTLNLLCWNLEHFRGGKQLERQGRFIFGRIAEHSVTFLLEGHSPAVVAQMSELLGRGYTVDGFDVGRELVIVIFNRENFRVAYRGLVDVGAPRGMAIFDVESTGCKTVYRVGALHAPAPNQEHMQTMMPKFLRACGEREVDVVLGDFNFDSAEISILGYAEATAGLGTSTITDTGPTARPGPIDRAWYLWKAVHVSRTVLLPVPDDDFATYKADVSDHLAVSLTVSRRNPLLE